MYDINSIGRGDALTPNRRNSLPCTDRTSDKGCAIKELVVCYVVWLGSMKEMGLRTCARCEGQDVYRAQVPQYPK